MMKSIMDKIHTINRREWVLGQGPLRPSHVHKSGFRGLFFEPRILYSVAVERPQALGWARSPTVKGRMPGEILPQGAQEKVTLSLRGEELVSWWSLLLHGLER